MPSNIRPTRRPLNPNFSSGPCAKRPGWTPAALANALIGRSHRSAEGRARLEEAIGRTRRLLRLPAGYRAAVMPGSDTGAFEAALWAMLGARGVDVLAWESFGRLWLTDVVDHLQLADVRRIEADFGALPDLGQVDFDRDVVFTWNGTTSGVRVPNAAWIAPDRKGLTFVDATSAIFAQAIDWTKTDVVSFSWQKVLGGEAAHGMLILSPRAAERLESFAPRRPLPKLFRLTKGGRLDDAIFAGQTINTPSMLCVEDYLDALAWAESIGGLDATIARSDGNAKVVHDWIARTPWVENLARDPATWSNTSICMRIGDPAIARGIVALLAKERVAFDIGAYRDAPPGLRIWTGATIERADIEALLPWLDWAYAEAAAMLTEK